MPVALQVSAASKERTAISSGNRQEINRGVLDGSLLEPIWTPDALLPDSGEGFLPRSEGMPGDKKRRAMPA